MSHSFSFIQHNHMPQKLVQGKVQHCTYAALVCQMKRGRSKIANFLSFGSSCSSGMHVGEAFTLCKTSTKFAPAPRKSHLKHKQVRKDKILRDCKDRRNELSNCTQTLKLKLNLNFFKLQIILLYLLKFQTCFNLKCTM